MLQFHKTKNEEWVVSGPEAEVSLGTNTVTKKDGTTEDVEVMRLGKVFEKDGVGWVYGYIYAKGSTSTKTRTVRANAYFAQLKKDELAKKAGVVRYCDLCGEEAEGIGRDNKGKLGDLCQECEGIDEDERVFS